MTRSARDEAIAFGEKVISLLDTSRFTASYKYAVLLALIDLCVERTDVDGVPPSTLPAKDVGRRVFELYWPQASPFKGQRLSQSITRGDVIEKIQEFRTRHGLMGGVSVEQARRAFPDEIEALEQWTIFTVIRMPLPRLQKFGAGRTVSEERFVYDYSWSEKIAEGRVRRGDFDDQLLLQGRAGEWLVRLAGLLRPLIKQQWAQFVADRNRGLVDEAYLEDFLFGAARIDLTPIRRPLKDAQDGSCFYCRGELRRMIEVDHFLPWSRHPDNGLFNLVAAHPACNNAKRDAFAALDPHLDRWVDRFRPASQDRHRFLAATRALTWPRHAGRSLGTARGFYLWLPQGTKLWRGPGDFVDHDPAMARRILGDTDGMPLAAEGDPGGDW